MEQIYLFSNVICTYIFTFQKNEAEAIFQGKKKHHFLTTPPRHTDQIHGYVLVKKPYIQILGRITFDIPLRKVIETLGDLLDNHSFDHSEGLLKRFGSKKVIYALPVVSYKECDSPITLKEIKQNCEGFRPPHSYGSLNDPEYSSLKSFLESRLK